MLTEHQKGILDSMVEAAKQGAKLSLLACGDNPPFGAREAYDQFVADLHKIQHDTLSAQNQESDEPEDRKRNPLWVEVWLGNDGNLQVTGPFHNHDGVLNDDHALVVLQHPEG
tara:strand:- start:11935 stop:12273 length:339 start_codon:yes stop_codon:yes gene_type:complete